ncbi:MAG: 16S rRNA (guanine(527)-N(7))-methyltransferase RsmG [Clostridiales bacterium]|nr:16S rRNA (guanine(527)-N(7))-methyltransferase RsmG [Clostridiales bacterium]
MKSIFEKFNISISQEQIEKFEKYYELLVFYNSKFNITAITERQEVIIKHFVDSVLGVDRITGNMLIDIGSGGGFPALPIKIMKEDISLTMLEATGKKCEFLKTVAKELDLKKVEVINGRAEEMAYSKEFREQFDCCTARAVARLNTLLEYTMPFVKVGGRLVSYKGDAQEEVKESKNAIEVLGGKIVEDYAYNLLDAKRQLISVEKIKPTPSNYPRTNAMIRKKPL